MKRIAVAVCFVLAVAGAKAQDCETIMLPYFHGDAELMASYPEEKLEWRCQYARNAFYESDSVPEGAVMRSITEVVGRFDGVRLTEDFVVDLMELSYYAYNFSNIQLEYKSPSQTVCFATPGSAHAYLVLRSLNDMYNLTEFPERYMK